MSKKRKLNNGEYLKIRIVDLEHKSKPNITERERESKTSSYSTDPLLLACVKGIENQNRTLLYTNTKLLYENRKLKQEKKELIKNHALEIEEQLKNIKILQKRLDIMMENDSTPHVRSCGDNGGNHGLCKRTAYLNSEGRCYHHLYT